MKSIEPPSVQKYRLPLTNASQTGMQIINSSSVLMKNTTQLPAILPTQLRPWFITRLALLYGLRADGLLGPNFRHHLRRDDVQRGDGGLTNLFVRIIHREP